MGSLFKRDGKGNYFAKYTDASGKQVRKSTGTANKATAAKIMARWEEDANALRHGLVPAGPGDIETLLEQYLAYLGNTTEDHRAKIAFRVRRVRDHAGWTLAREINQYHAETAVRAFLSSKTGEKLSIKTQNGYITSLKAFTAWLTHVRMVLPRDPLKAIRKQNAERDRKRVRRFLLAEEWPWLARTPNALLYKTAIQTGLRARELMALQPIMLKDDHILLPAKHDKRGVQARQYITADLRNELEGRLPFEVVGGQPDRLAEALAQDLAIARSLYEEETEEPDEYLLHVANAAGHVLDFHGLRHTCGAWLAIKNVSPKVIQTVMRHSTITLTLDTYGHLLPTAERAAVEQFEAMMDGT